MMQPGDRWGCYQLIREVERRANGHDLWLVRCMECFSEMQRGVSGARTPPRHCRECYRYQPKLIEEEHHHRWVKRAKQAGLPGPSGVTDSGALDHPPFLDRPMQLSLGDMPDDFHKCCADYTNDPNPTP